MAGLVVRTHRPGDVGWSLMRQAEVYSEEFGYAPVFETYVAAGIPPFLEAFDPRLDALWVAELDGQRMGCIAVHHDPQRPGWAKARWFLVEAEARGKGVGTRLLDTLVAFARAARYEGIYLWTCSDLEAAASLYRRTGFTRVEEAECPWKPDIRQERWELGLA